MARLRGGLLLVTAIFALYGLKELVGAVRNGDSIHDGVESLVIGALTSGAYLLLTKFDR